MRLGEWGNLHDVKACSVIIVIIRLRYGLCANKLVRDGKTSVEQTRWRCKHCGASTTGPRPDITAKAQFELWISWLLSTRRQRDFRGPQSKFKRDTVWCWSVVPQAPIIGETHRCIML